MILSTTVNLQMMSYHENLNSKSNKPIWEIKEDNLFFNNAHEIRIEFFGLFFIL